MQDRGPTTQRGLQFSRTAVPELLEALARAKTKLQQIEGTDRAELQALSKSELATMRKQVLELQTDLRAELRRRNEI
jgi:hypothetical protein